MKLRAIITELEDGSAAVQLLELDIATVASSQDGVLDAVRHALCAEYQIAVENDIAPFDSIPEAPERFFRLWRTVVASGATEKVETIELPREVLYALAWSLRTETPQFTITELRQAA